MFVDELTIHAKAGNGGDGVVRWRHEKHKPNAGPAGGNGGRGGDVFVRAVSDLNRLSKYTGAKTFAAEDGDDGRKSSEFGKGGEAMYIDLPVGSTITDLDRDRSVELTSVGETICILKGGGGGLGNEYFKSSTNRSPEQSTKGRTGEEGTFKVSVALIADVGLIGMPNAGKSSLLNSFTNATSTVGAYPFTTTQPHLGTLYEFTLVDIPGLIDGAASGKGLGHTFLRHVQKTKMLLHLVPLEAEDPEKQYYAIRNELSQYDKSLLEKEEWIIFTKSDLVNKSYIESLINFIDNNEKRVFVISTINGDGVKELRDSLVLHLRDTYNGGHTDDSNSSS